MKKLLLFLIATLFVFSGIFAQTAHSELYSNDTFTKSMVTVSSMNSYNSYAVGIFKDLVYVTQLDNNTPQGLQTSSCRFFNIPVHDVILKGGFFDEDDNIVVYGFVSTINNGYINNGIIIKINMSNTLPISVRYTISEVSNTPVTDGCYSRAGANKTYSFIVANKYFMRVSATMSTSFPTTTVKTFAGINPTMMSVSWDADNSKHVISGCAIDYNSQFVNFIGTMQGVSLIPNGTFYLYKPTGYSPAEYSNTHVLSGNGYFSDSTAYLIQDLRGNNGDILWTMQVNYITGAVLNNVGIRFSSEKMSIIDAAHNFDNLFVLGTHIGSRNGSSFCNRYLAQINLYDMTNRVVKHSTDYLLGSIGFTSLERNEGYLNNICYNHATSFVQAAGAISNNGNIVEVFDMNYSSCENTETIQNQNVNYTTLNSNSLCNTIAFMNIWGSNPALGIQENYYSTYSHFISENCVSFDYEDLYLAKRDEIQSLVLEKQELNSNADISQKNVEEEGSKIDVLEYKSFVCKDFKGTCTYKVYDIYGRLVTEGNTFNGNHNDLNINVPGMYLIKVIDENNNFRTEKVVINE